MAAGTIGSVRSRRLCLVLVLFLAACGDSQHGPLAAPLSSTTHSSSTDAPVTAAPADDQAPTATATPISPLSESVTSLGSALYDPTEHRPAIPPIGLSIEAIGVRAPVVSVGVEADGDMEIPGAREVGWYRFGPAPGESGSSVLAAHIAWNGERGVFRALGRVREGDRIDVTLADGEMRGFEVVETAQYGKEELPFDRIFAKDGAPGLVLISCGGDFNRQLNSYEDNIVIYARPIP